MLESFGSKCAAKSGPIVLKAIARAGILISQQRDDLMDCFAKFSHLLGRKASRLMNWGSSMRLRMRLRWRVILRVFRGLHRRRFGLFGSQRMEFLMIDLLLAAVRV